MLHILDTDVLSNLEKAHPNRSLVAWLESMAAEDIAISLATVFEIQMGIELARPRHPERAAEKERWLEDVVQARSARIIDPDTRTARLQAKMLTTPALKDFLFPDPGSKKPKTGADLIIAATAIVHEAMVVTFNIRDFVRIHDYFPLPGVFHPGTGEHAVPPSPSRSGPDDPP